MDRFQPCRVSIGAWWLHEKKRGEEAVMQRDIGLSLLSSDVRGYTWVFAPSHPERSYRDGYLKEGIR